MSRAPSPPRARSDAGWEALANKLKDTGRTPSLSSQDTADRKSAGSGYTSYADLDTSDIRLFRPQDPEEARRQGRARRKDEMTGWTFRGNSATNSGGTVNVLKRDAMLLDLAVEGKTTLEAQLKVCEKAIIGLDEIIEYIDPDAEESSCPRVYSCKLCGVFRSVATIMEHIQSYNHRVRTIRKRFPNEVKAYLLPDGKTINRSPGLAFIAQKRASEIELVYGRGDVDVRRERPVYPDEAMEAADSDLMVLTDTKHVEFLTHTLGQLKQYKIQSQEESRIVKAIIDQLSDALIDWRVQANNPAAN